MYIRAEENDGRLRRFYSDSLSLALIGLQTLGKNGLPLKIPSLTKLPYSLDFVSSRVVFMSIENIEILGT